MGQVSARSIQREPAAKPPETKAPEPQPPPTRGPKEFTGAGFGKWDAKLEPRGKAPGPNAQGFLCALMATTKVQLNFRGPWPAGSTAPWTKRFTDIVAEKWSGRYLLTPEKPCSSEGCSSVVVYVKVEPVTSGAHHVVNVDYKKPFNTASFVGSGGRTGQFYEDDLRSGLSRQRTALHEAGHFFGLTHIECDSNGVFCYGISYGEGDDVMGRGEYVSARDYAPFAESATQLSGCKWRVPEGQGAAHEGSWILRGAIIGGLLGALGGIAGSLSPLGVLGVAAGGALIGGLLGSIPDIAL